MSTQIKREALLAQIHDLPPLPQTVMTVVRAIDNPKSSVSDIAKALSHDPAMAARILKLANSAYYGATRRISTVTDAVVLIGFRTLRNLAMALSCQKVLSRTYSGYALQQGELWRHSHCSAMAAQLFALRCRYPKPEEAFVGGLLHDLGKIILNGYHQELFTTVAKLTREKQIPFMEAERDVIGFDHAEVGALILESWNFPETLVGCVRYHHAPSEQANPSHLTAIVHLSELTCRMLGIGIGGDGLLYPLDSEVLKQLRLTERDFEEITAQVSEFALLPEAA